MMSNHFLIYLLSSTHRASNSFVPRPSSVIPFLPPIDATCLGNGLGSAVDFVDFAKERGEEEVISNMQVSPVVSKQ